MASLHQIQRNMTKQQQEIDALIARQKQDRARLLEENRRNLEAIRKQYEAALKKHDQQTDAAYRKALDDMQFKLTDVYRKQLDALRQFDEAARRERELRLQELEKTVQTLHREVEEIKKRSQQREENSRAEAESMLRSAEQADRQTEQVPHDFFYPGELTIIRSSVDAARDMEGNGMYDASTATALGAVTQMRLLQAKTTQAEDGWYALWTPYSQWLGMIEDEMTALKKDEIETVSGIWTLDEDSLDDFSMGYYSKTQKKLDRVLEPLHRVQEVGTPESLMQKIAPSGPAIQRAMPEILQLQDEMTALRLSVTMELVLSDEREDIGKKAVQLLKEFGYSLKSADFVDGDPLKAYVVSASMERDYEVEIHIYPNRVDGIAKNNEVLVTITSRAAGAMVSLQELKNGWTQRMKGILPAEIPLQVETDDPHPAIVPRISGEELLAPDTYAQKLRKRYQTL